MNQDESTISLFIISPNNIYIHTNILNMSATITSITPTNNPNQKNIKIDNQTSDIVLTQIGVIIYINSSSLEHLRGIAM